MNIRMWPDDSPPDLSNELARAEEYAGNLEAAIYKLEREKEHLQERVAGLQLCYVEAREAARWLWESHHPKRGSKLSDHEKIAALQAYPWLKEDAT